MTRLPQSSPFSSIFSLGIKSCLKVLLVISTLVTMASTAFAAPAATSISLAISATSVPYKTPITLTATVTSGGAPITAGLVLFCEATATYCENNSALGIAQLTYPGSTASVKVGSGPIGNHSYKAVFKANKSYLSSTSNTVTYAVTGTYLSTTSLTSTGTIGNYTLTGAVQGIGSLTSAPAGSIDFLDTSDGNNVLGTETLSVSTLSTTFIQNQAFAIGPDGATTRSVAIASAYLNSDNNLDVVTGDSVITAAQGQPPLPDTSTITVLLGNGDGTFQPKTNFAGCTVGSAVQIVLADFNRDGNTDIALGCSNRSKGTGGTLGGLVIILGNGDGTFQTPTYYSTGDVSSIATGDFNGDGLLDIALTDNAQQNVIFFTGNGDGTFTQETNTITTSSSARGVVVADFNNDGIDDVAFAVTAEQGGETLCNLYMAISNGDGTFNVSANPVAKQIGEFLTAGDTDGNNTFDIVSATITEPGNPQKPNPLGNSLFVLLGNGDGTFQTPAVYFSDIPSDPHLADVNGDGIPDIIAGGSIGALVYQGKGDGTFVPYAPGSLPDAEPIIGGFILTYAVNAGDYNNDGNADLIGTDANTPHAAVSLSQVQQASNASALTSVAVFPLGSGVHQVDASYSGDSIYIGSVSTTVPLTAAPVDTTLNLVVSPNINILTGQTVTLTADLSPYTVTPPTTTTDGEAVQFFSGTTSLGTANLSSGVATLTTTALLVGSDSITAKFPGDSNYNPSTSNSVTATVANILLSSSLNPSTYSQSVTFTATVPAGKTGTVTFFDGSTNIGTGTISAATATLTTSTLAVGSHNITAQFNSSTSAVLAQVVNKMTPNVAVSTSGPSIYGSPVTITATVPTAATGTITFTSGTTALGSGTVSNGSVSIITSVLTPPSDPITAVYGGDSNYNTATGTTTQTVSKATPTATLTSSVNPSTINNPVIFTDTLSSGVTGTVVFSYNSTTLGTSTITNGVATLTTSSLPAGGDLITAVYSGDTNYSTLTSTLTQNVSKETTTVTVSTSGASYYGQSVTITASVPLGPTGTITITSGGVTLGSGTITSTNGTVTISTTALPVGLDQITATYGGDTVYSLATGTVNQTVSKASPSLNLTSSHNPSTYGQSVTFTASLPAGATGTVTFTSGGTTLGTSNLASGVAIFSTSALPVGPDEITAIYNGDANNNTANGSLTQTVIKATPTVNVTTSGPSNYGVPVTITATLPIGTTGTVTFTYGTTTLGSGSVNSTTGTVSVTTSTLPVGPDTITASYGGDGNYNPNTGTTTQTVSKAQPTVTVTSSLNPSAVGQSVTFTATLPSAATGTVTFTDGTMTLGTSTLTNGVATATTTTLPVGTDSITATYNGDSNYSSNTGTLSQVVNKATPTITVTTSGPSTYGNPVTITTTLPPGTTGTVTVTSGGTTLGTGTVNPTTGTVTITTTSLPVGSDPITSSYGGDGNNSPVIGTTTQTVTKASPAVGLTSSLNPSTVTQAVTFTASIATNATGTITFLDGGTSIGTGTITNGVATLTTSTLTAGVHTITASYGGDANNNAENSAPLSQTVSKNTPILPIPVVSTTSPVVGTSVTITETVPPGVSGPVTFYNGSTPIGTAPIIGGVATITTSTLPLGTNPITASTPGDANNNPATSPSVAVTVVKTAPTVTVTSSLNPSIIHQSVTFTASAPAGATGTITFLDGTTVLGTGTLASGQTTLTTSSLTVGSHSITVTYGGDSNNNPATSVPLTQIVNKATPVIPPPAVSSSTIPVGGQETITETVPPGVTGTVTFNNGSTPIGTAPIVGGVATITVSTLPLGSDPITATTSGDTNNNPATSAPTTVTVTPPVPVLVAPIVSSSNPAPNTPVTITEPIPTGVTGPVSFYNGTTLLGTAPIINGQATLTVPSLPIGVDPITVTAINSSTSTLLTSPPTQVTVTKVAQVVSLTSSVNPSSPGQSVTFSASVHTGATGTITFLDGATTLGTGTLNAAGVATFTTSTLAIGSHPITASYGGDSTYNAATSAVLTQVVGQIPTITTITESAPAQLLHTGVTFTANVTAPSPNATGTVTFMDGTTILGTAALSANGTTVVTLTTNANAAYATSNLVTGQHQITAVYSGDSNFAPSTSAPATNVVEDFTNTNSGAASQNMFPGAATTYTFTLAPVGATTFLNDVTVSVAGLPPGSTYTFSPATITAGSGSTQITLSVQTSATLSAQNHLPQTPAAPHTQLPIALGIIGLAGLGATRKLRHKIPRTLMLLLLTLGSLLPIAALSGCAGGYFTLNPTTYSLTVTGVEGPVQHAATATLIVQ
jgi:hypothetical protein